MNRMNQFIAVMLVATAMTVLLSACVTTTTGNQPPEPDLEAAAVYNTELGRNYIQQGKYEIAMDRLQRAVKQNPNSPISHATIAFLYSIIGDSEKADAHYRRALKLTPDDSLTLNAYGVFLCRENQPLKAMKYFDAALEDRLYRMPEVAYTNAGRCARTMNDNEQADSYFRNALKVNPAFCDALWQMADINLVEDRSLQARGFLQRYLDTPCDAGPETLWLGINIERDLGDERAVDDYTTRLKNAYPESVQMKLLLESEKNAG